MEQIQHSKASKISEQSRPKDFNVDQSTYQQKLESQFIKVFINEASSKFKSTSDNSNQQKLLDDINKEGIFSSGIQQILSLKFEHKDIGKIHKLYQKLVLCKIIDDKFQGKDVDLQPKNYKRLIQSIRQKDQQKLKQELTQFIEQDDQDFYKITEQFIKLGQKPTKFIQRNDKKNQQPTNQQIQINEQLLLIREKQKRRNQIIRQCGLLNEQLRKKKFDTINQQATNQQTIKQLITLKQDYGAYSSVVASFIKDLKFSKVQKNKFQKAFDSLFRNLQLPLKVKQKFQELQMEESDLNQILNQIIKYVKQGNIIKIQKLLLGWFDQGVLFDQLISKLTQLIPQEIKKELNIIKPPQQMNLAKQILPIQINNQRLRVQTNNQRLRVSTNQRLPNQTINDNDAPFYTIVQKKKEISSFDQKQKIQYKQNDVYSQNIGLIQKREQIKYDKIIQKSKPERQIPENVNQQVTKQKQSSSSGSKFQKLQDQADQSSQISQDQFNSIDQDNIQQSNINNGLVFKQTLISKLSAQNNHTKAVRLQKSDIKVIQNKNFNQYQQPTKIQRQIYQDNFKPQNKSFGFTTKVDSNKRDYISTEYGPNISSQVSAAIPKIQNKGLVKNNLSNDRLQKTYNNKQQKGFIGKVQNAYVEKKEASSKLTQKQITPKYPCTRLILVICKKDSKITFEQKSKVETHQLGKNNKNKKSQATTYDEIGVKIEKTFQNLGNDYNNLKAFVLVVSIPQIYNQKPINNQKIRIKCTEKKGTFSYSNEQTIQTINVIDLVDQDKRWHQIPFANATFHISSKFKSIKYMLYLLSMLEYLSSQKDSYEIYKTLNYALMKSIITQEQFIQGLIQLDNLQYSHKDAKYLKDFEFSKQCAYLILIALININTNWVYQTSIVKLSDSLILGTSTSELLPQQSNFLKIFPFLFSFQKYQIYAFQQFVPKKSYDPINLKRLLRIVIHCNLIRIRYGKKYQSLIINEHIIAFVKLTQKIDQKLSLIQQICTSKPTMILQKGLQQSLNDILYLSNKQKSGQTKLSICDYLIVNFTLISRDIIISKNKISSASQQKRQYIIQLLKLIQNHLVNKRAHQLQYQRKQLQKLKKQKKYQKLIKSVMMPQIKYNTYGGYTYQQQFLFYTSKLTHQFVQSIYKIQTQFEINLETPIIKSFCEDRFYKAIQYFILYEYGKSSDMIACLASFPKGQRQLEKFISRNQTSFNYRFSFNFLLKKWFTQKFRPSEMQYFSKLFQKILILVYKRRSTSNNVSSFQHSSQKAPKFYMVEFLKTIAQIYEIKIQTRQYVVNFVNFILKSMRNLATNPYPQLDDIPIHLPQISNINEQIKQLYLLNLTDFLLIEGKITYSSLQNLANNLYNNEDQTSQLSKKDKQFVLRRLFTDQKSKSKAQLSTQIFDCLNQNNRDISVLSYYKEFSFALNDVFKCFKQKKIDFSVIDSIKKHKQQLKVRGYQKKFIQFYQNIAELYEEVQLLRKKIDHLTQILTLYRQKSRLFTRQIEELSTLNKQLNTMKLQRWIEKTRTFDQYLIVSEQLLSLIKIPLWDHQQIKYMTDLLVMRQTTIQKFDDLIQNFQQNNMKFQQFSKYFRRDIIGAISQRIKNKTLKDRLVRYVTILDKKVFQYAKTSIRSINQVSLKIQHIPYFDDDDIKIIQELQTSQQLDIQTAFNKMILLEQKFKKINFQIIDDRDQLLKTFNSILTYKRVFDLIEQKKVDSQTILNDLKQYINDVQNSILRLEDIKQLQNVVKFVQTQQKSTQFLDFLQQIRQQAKTYKLSESIFNIDSKIKQFEQIIDSCANRQTSFKYDLQQIFKNSLVRINNHQGFAQIEIIIQKRIQNILNQKGEQVRIQRQAKIFNFKQLTDFKEKTNLLVSDFQRSVENQNIMQETLNEFKSYIDLYKNLQQIQLLLHQAIVFGYNPLDFTQRVLINSFNQTNAQNITQIQEMKDQIQKQSNQWILNMRQIYEKSFLLTHLMGPQLNKFINQVYEGKFNPLIMEIIGVGQEEFYQTLQALKIIYMSNNNLKQIQKVKMLCKLFQELQKRSRSSKIINPDYQMGQKKCKNPIELITCLKVENYYFALVKDGLKPELNQILYCQKQTTFQEIQIFLKRAIMKNSKKHYFMGTHYLPAEVQLKFIDKLNKYLKSDQDRLKFSKCKLCFIDNSAVQKVYLHLLKKSLFDAKQITDTHLKTRTEINSVLNNCKNAYLIESRVSGLGKTYRAEHINPKSNRVYFSIAGNIDFTRLMQRLKSQKFDDKGQNTLIIQIGHVQDKIMLQIFLFQIIFFKGFNFKQFFFLPKRTTIVVEMENIFQQDDKYKIYSILKIIKQNTTQNYIYLDKFNVNEIEFNRNDVKQVFTLYYLRNVNQTQPGNLGQRQVSYQQFTTQYVKNPNSLVCDDNLAKNLIQEHFLNPLINDKTKTQPTFSLYHSFMKLLFTSFKTFSKNGCFNVEILNYNHSANKNLGFNTVRLVFLKCCIQNCLDFLKATINTNEVTQNQIQEQNQTIINEDFRARLSKFPFLIMPAHDFQNYQFVYLNSQKVHISIKSLFVSQSIFKFSNMPKYSKQKSQLQRSLSIPLVQKVFSENSLQTLKNEDLQRQIYRIIHQLSGNNVFDIEKKTLIKQFKQKQQHKNIQNYSITLDNFFKMCLIIQRAVSHIPIIIQGQSGVGKTALIKFLVEVVFQHTFLLINIHAGIDQNRLITIYQEIVNASRQLQNEKQNQLKRMNEQRKLQEENKKNGIKNDDKNDTIKKRFQWDRKVWVFFDEFNTTNQLSYIKQMLIDRRFQGQPIPQNVVLIAACNPYRKRYESNYKRAGIKKRLAQRASNEQNLAFKVNPPSLSMIQYMWDYQQLCKQENMDYTSKILQSLNLKEHRNVVRTIALLHEQFKANFEISSVSLRDVARFKELFIWFLKNMPRKVDQVASTSSSLTQGKQKYKQNPNYKMSQQQRAISLSLAFCYSLRIADKHQRKRLLENATHMLNYKIQIEQVVQNQQIDYVQRFTIPQERIAINFSLRQNIFTTLICLMNKIPILIIGNPGNSKSLSIRMINHNLRGSAGTQFCKKFPQLNLIYFQGSEACTSKGVQLVFQKASKSNNDYNQKKKHQKNLGDVQTGVLFDQIGLAQQSKHNPLKVLHSKLETTNKQLCFIGISNWQLDAAKMSRFLTLSRTNPQKDELSQTAKKILETYLGPSSYHYQKHFTQMSNYYYDFVNQWDRENLGNYNEGFFGLRDFYCYIKYIAEQLSTKTKTQLTFQELLKKSIQINFDGQPESINKFLNIAGLQTYENISMIEPIQLVEENLSLNCSRSLLLIVRGDALLPIITSKIKVKGKKMKVQCIYGSAFEADQLSQQYNSQVTSMIIAHMSKGTVLAFKNPNSSIQTSLYDVFNKSFTQSGNKKYCRVAVGANSNPKCVVHQNFGSIVFMDEHIIKNTDLAFLNRFQKHYLTLASVIDNTQKQIILQINKWITQILAFKNKTQFKKQEHYLINSSDQSIATLIIRYREFKDIGRKIKKSLLKNSTPHFHIALKDDKNKYIPVHLKEQIYELLKQIAHDDKKLVLQKKKSQKREKHKSQSQQPQRELQTRESQQPEELYQMSNRIPQNEMMGINRYQQNSNQNARKDSLTNKDNQISDFAEQQLLDDKIIFTFDQGIYSADTYTYCTQKTYKIRISQIKSQRQLRKSLQSAFNSQKFDNIHILIDFSKQFQHVNIVAFLLTGMKADLKSSKKIYVFIKLSQISLDNADREHINISYLLDFEQRFIDSLTNGMTFLQSIEGKNIKQIYQQKAMQQNFDNLYIQAQSRFRLMQNQIKATKSLTVKDIKQFQFGLMSQMYQNPTFKQYALKFIYSNLNQSPIDLSIILNNKQQRRICHSPQQMFEKYVQGQVINLICCFFDRIYRNNMLFSFDILKMFNFFQQTNAKDTSLLKGVYTFNQQDYKKLLVNLIDVYINNTETIIPTYRKQCNSNPIQIKSFGLLPMNLNDLDFITNTNQDSFIKMSSKILSLSISTQAQAIQQCRLLTERCFVILTQKSIYKKCTGLRKTFNFIDFMNQNQSLQIFYFYDLIESLYADSIDNYDIPQSRIIFFFVNVFIKIFKQFSLHEKIIILTLNQQTWSYIFNLWGLWLSNKNSDFYKQVITHYIRMHSLQRVQVQDFSLPKIFIELCASTKQLQENLLSIDYANIQTYGVEKYFSFFRKTYFYTQKLILSYNQYEIEIDKSNPLKVIKRFFDLLQTLFTKQQIQQELTMFLTINQKQFEPKVEIYLSQVLLKKAKNKKQTQLILQYLSLQTYPAWIQRLQLVQQIVEIQNQIKKCITSFIDYSNESSYFANNSTFFIQTIFTQFDNEATIQDKRNYLQIQQDQYLTIMNQKIDFSKNFAVTLGHFFFNIIQGIAQQQQKQQEQGNNKIIQMEQQIIKDSFLKKYFKIFQDFSTKNFNNNKILDIFALEFCKVYCLRYLQVMKLNQQPQMLTQIDKILCIQTMHSDHLRLFLLKNLLYQEKKMGDIKVKYLQSLRCKWMKFFQDKIAGKVFQYLVPPEFKQQQNILALIQNFRDSNYEAVELFNVILNQSIRSPKAKYEFLTFMMNDVYSRVIPEQVVATINVTIGNSQIYKNGNSIQLCLLKCYTGHFISPFMEYKIPTQKQTSQVLSQHFIRHQLVFLNNINMLIALSGQQNPLIEMFFNKDGLLPQKYHQWIQNRFLINGKQNLGTSILNGFIQRNDPTPGYYKCSHQCDLYYTIGGNGYGCQYPNGIGTCAWCKKQIGGTGHTLVRLNQGARKVQMAQLPIQRQLVRQKKRINILNLKLNGYNYNPNMKLMLGQMLQNYRISPTSRFLLQQILYSFWSFLSSSKILSQSQIKQSFKSNDPKAFSQQCLEVYRHYFYQIGKRNQFDVETNVIWHLGVMKRVFNMLIQYKPKLPQNVKEKSGLIYCLGRDHFQSTLQALVVAVANGNQKIALINQARTIKAGVKVSGHQILKQTDGYEKYLQQYPKIRLIKLLDYKKSADFTNFVKQYSQVFKRQYPLLNYFITNQQKIKISKKFREIYSFVSKIVKQFNNKITRQQAQKNSLLKLYQQVSQSQQNLKNSSISTFKTFRQEITKFGEIWNQLRDMKFDLRYDCHSLGKMDQTTEKLNIDTIASNYFPDAKYKGDQKGQMLLSLLQVSAKQYNITCTQLDQLRMSSKKYRQTQVFNKKLISPTQIQPLIKTLVLQRKKTIQQKFIQNYSNWSVQYGCPLPHYSINKIESLLVQQMVGSHFLNQNNKDYDEIHYIGEQLNFISQIRGMGITLNWQDVPRKQDIQKYIYGMKQTAPDNFLKQISNIKASLQQILRYFTLKKPQFTLTIQYFVTSNAIGIKSDHLMGREMFYTLQLKYLLVLYEFIELQTLHIQFQCLDDSYKRDILDQQQKTHLHLFIKNLKQKDRQVLLQKQKINQESLKDKQPTKIAITAAQKQYHLMVALYRFVARRLSLVEIKEDMILYHYIIEAEDLWPSGFNIQAITHIQGFQQTFSLPLTKMQGLLEMIPLTLRKSKTEVINIDQEKADDRLIKNINPPEQLSKAKPKATKKKQRQ